MQFLKLHSGSYKDLDYYQKIQSVLYSDAVENNTQMETVLKTTVEQALECPALLDIRDQLLEINTLEELCNSGIYTNPNNILPTEVHDWTELLGHSDVVFSAKTSGSSGIPKIMPFTQAAIDHATLGFAPFIAEYVLELREQGIDKIVMLALTASEDFVTYHAIPQISVNTGITVVHAPLSTILRNPKAAQELADYIMQNDIHILGTVAPMVFPLIESLKNSRNGQAALGKLISTTKIGMYGGTEIYPKLENTLREMFGYVINLFASTEFLIPAASCGESPCQTMFFNPNYCIPGIIPLEELQNDEENHPGMTLLNYAMPGSIGELVITSPLGFPWINARTGDYVQVVKIDGPYTSPAKNFFV